MKKLFLLFMMTAMAFLYSKGQAWSQDEPVWHYDFHISGSGFYKIELGADTLIQNKLCQKYVIRKHTFHSQPSGIYLLGHIYDMPANYTYSSGDTVFYYKNNKFFILFNFAASIGDQWVIDDEPQPMLSFDTLSIVTVIDTGSIVLNGEKLRKIQLEAKAGSPMGIDSWVVEKIGPVTGDQYLFPTGRVSRDSIYVCFEQVFFKCFDDNSIGFYNPSGIDCEYLLNHVGVEEIDKPLFQVYPNPSADFIHIAFGKTGQYRMSLFDASGRLVKSGQLSQMEEKIDLSTLANGVYTLRIDAKEGNSSTQKIIKK